MLNIIYGHDQSIRPGINVAVTNPVTAINEGAILTLNSAGALVKTGVAANIPVPVFFAFEGANVPGKLNTGHETTGKISVIKGTFIAETDQYVTTATYAAMTALTYASGLLAPATVDVNGLPTQFVVGWALSAPVGGKLKFVTN